MKKFSVFPFLCASLFCFSQEKDEKETRISILEFPEVAQPYFGAMPQKVKSLKFYKETDGDKQSFEAKFKINRQYYSIEFDIHGILEDIEIAIKEKHVPKKALSEILEYFDANFKKTRILKIQKQYVNTTDKSDKAFIQKITGDPGDKHSHFEIVAEIKHKHELREFIFDRNGLFISFRTITPSSYDHVLY